MGRRTRRALPEQSRPRAQVTEHQMNVDICNESGVEVDTDALLDLVRHVLDEMRGRDLASSVPHRERCE